MVLRLFRALLPKNHRFVEDLSAHSRHVVSGATSFRDLLAGDAVETHYATLCGYEEQADAVTRTIVEAIHRSFITPFDRSQILELTTALDDTIDLMKEAGRRIRIYGVAFTPEMRAMGDCALRATTALCQAMPLLADISGHLPGFASMQDQVRAAEAEADRLLDQGLRTLFAGEGSAGQKLTVEKVYDLIEQVVDRCEDVADLIEGIVVEHV